MYLLEHLWLACFCRAVHLAMACRPLFNLFIFSPGIVRSPSTNVIVYFFIILFYFNTLIEVRYFWGEPHSPQYIGII